MNTISTTYSETIRAALWRGQNVYNCKQSNLRNTAIRDEQKEFHFIAINIIYKTHTSTLKLFYLHYLHVYALLFTLSTRLHYDSLHYQYYLQLCYLH